MMMFLVCGSTKQAKAFDFYQAIAGFGVIQNSIGNENVKYLSTSGAAEGRDLCVAIKGMGDFIQAHKKFNLALGNDYGERERHSNNIFKRGEDIARIRINDMFGGCYKLEGQCIDVNRRIAGTTVREALLNLSEQGRILAYEWYYRWPETWDTIPPWNCQ